MKYLDNIKEVSSLQPDYLGFIFYEKSSRFFEGKLPEIPKQIKKVGVFVDADISDIIGKVIKHELNIIQLHGNEDELYVLRLNIALRLYSPDVLVWKVFSIDDHFKFNKLKPFENKVDKFLFDTKGKQPGGNGFTFNWNILNSYPSSKPFILSGGIGIDEIDNLKTFFKNDVSKYCYALDINSKFEITPGLKDIEKLKKINLNYEL
ncbi:phosphoribosylanthranilate isomerase [Xanthomarina sp. F2636L]|uniref:phosphoribosylanthranilate isomerase n=1 Tax=Xanthomarina sp. F2636L TaxID=2996018 RepID=UPI00225E5A48|nr:phosphoribosylanthranilate isomerase [Xanthomarina sp. F2636L]MCX7551898.1 phosphoribosylanthranilate isomerase [Xanthomarina sp. F2636L]